MGMDSKLPAIMSNAKYKPLPPVAEDKTSAHSHRCGQHWCPKVTRLKAAGLLALIFLAAVLVLLGSSRNINILHDNAICCDTAKVSNVTLSIPQRVTPTVLKEALPSKTQRYDQYEAVHTDEEIDDEIWAGKNLRAKHQSRRLPQCIIIGARKGGTRALLEFLNIHPYIIAAKSEIHFFDYDENYENGLGWYRRRMPFSYSDQVTIEKSPSYFVEENVPERIHAMNESIKLLLIVRNPIDRAVSDYLQILENRKAKNKPLFSFEEMALTDGEVNRSYSAIKRSVYHRFMRRWLGVFSLNQFHIVDGDHFVKDPLKELRLIEDFLGLEHRITADNVYFNRTRGFFCIRNETTQKCLSKSKGRKHPELDRQALETLKEFFRPLNQKFYRMVNRNFQWF